MRLKGLTPLTRSLKELSCGLHGNCDVRVILPSIFRLLVLAYYVHLCNISHNPLQQNVRTCTFYWSSFTSLNITSVTKSQFCESVYK